jgi:PAS domain S-box-containing protein
MVSLQIRKNEKKIGHSIDSQLSVLFDNANEYKICMLDKNGRIIGWNLSAEKMTGYSSADVLGKNYSMFISDEERKSNVIKKILRVVVRKGQYTAEGIRTRKDGTHFFARSNITALKEADGKIKFFVLITRNISAERETAQRRDEYIGIASHELKNPLTTLSLYSELLHKGLELEGNKRNLGILRDIQGQTTRLVGLVDDLLIVSKIESGTLELNTEVFNPNTFVAQLVKVFQKNVHSHKIICKARLVRQVRADKNKISQVLINLLTNAVKYSPRADKVVVHIEQKASKCVISVQDFGAGISKADQRDIFTRFFRAHDAEAGNIAGAGLGLYISKEIIKRHNQRLFVKSTKGKGTTFSFTLSSVPGSTIKTR